ncbi:MAG: hypothetical protein QE271_01595 [Bacteriovoracaceae bacterium]|nr:hypothetical protein [Bacteriovoracaceae bacterium]
MNFFILNNLLLIAFIFLANQSCKKETEGELFGRNSLATPSLFNSDTNNSQSQFIDSLLVNFRPSVNLPATLRSQCLPSNNSEYFLVPHGLKCNTTLPSNHIQDIAVINNNIFLATDRGLAISQDVFVGRAYKVMTTADGLLSNYIFDIAVNEQNIILLGTTLGMSFSSDGGQTFKSIEFGFNILNIATYGSNIIYAVSKSGLFVSQDFGQSGGYNFYKISQNILPAGFLSSVAVDTNGGLYVGSQTGIFYSADGGGSFSQILSSQRITNVYINKQNVVFASSEDNGIFYSAKVGNSFTFKNYGPNYALGYSPKISFDSSGKIYLSTKNGVLVSTDQAASFNPIANSTNTEAVTNLLASYSSYLFFSTESGLFISTNVGVTGFAQSAPVKYYPGGAYYSNDLYVKNNVIYVVGDKGLIVSTNGGETFAPLGNFDVKNLLSVRVTKNNKIVVQSIGHTFYVLDLLGNILVSKTIPSPAGNLSSIPNIAEDNQNRIYIVIKNEIWVSDISGINYVKLAKFDEGISGLKIDENNNMYVTADSLYTSDNLGQTFSKKNNITGFDYGYYLLGASKGLVAVGGREGRIAISEDKGQTFKTYSIPLTQRELQSSDSSLGFIQSFAINSNGDMYVLKNKVLTISRDKGASFTVKDSSVGLTDFIGEMYNVFVDENNAVYVLSLFGMSIARK